MMLTAFSLSQVIIVFSSAESTAVISGTEKTDICAGVIRIAFSFEFTVRKQDISIFQSKKGSLAVSRIIFGKIRADIRGNLS